VNIRQIWMTGLGQFSLYALLIPLAIGCSAEKAEQVVDNGDAGREPAPTVEQVETAPVAPPIEQEQRPAVQQQQQPIQQQPAFQAPQSMQQPMLQQQPVVEPAPGGEQSLQFQPRMAPMQAQPQVRRFQHPQAVQGEASPHQQFIETLQAPEAEMAAPQVSPVPAEPMSQEAPSDDPYDVVEVFYGTDRAPILWPTGAWLQKYHEFLPTITCLLVGMIFGLAMLQFKQYTISILIILISVSFGFVLGHGSWVEYQKQDRFLSNSSTIYGSERGNLGLGTCKVSIPKIHQAGVLESPSILKLEFEELPEQHVVLLEVKSREEQEFWDLMQARVMRAPNRDLMIFIHGYNVSFEDAARRTAQMAHDLQFQGAPVFFSWPSQGELLGYVTDRNNSAWTASHLKDFLLKVHQQSGAESIHLIAHSMGNRALGTAIKSLADDVGQEGKLFNEVVLAAPDVDREVFTQEIAPRMLQLSNHVTLYASQNDLALKVSRAVNGYPRAGDVGPGVLVLAGIDTIDVSQIDSSLLGHAYYGDNTSVISDIHALLHVTRFPQDRVWLRDVSAPMGMYWYFDPTANPTETPTALRQPQIR